MTCAPTDRSGVHCPNGIEDWQCEIRVGTWQEQHKRQVMHNRRGQSERRLKGRLIQEVIEMMGRRHALTPMHEGRHVTTHERLHKVPGRNPPIDNPQRQSSQRDAFLRGPFDARRLSPDWRTPEGPSQLEPDFFADLPDHANTLVAAK